MGIESIAGMAILLVIGLLIGLWLGRNSLSALVTASQQRIKDLESRNGQQESELLGLRAKQSSTEIEKARSETELESARQSLTEERASFNQLKNDMEKAFSALAADSLRSNNRQFLDLANEKFEAKEHAINTLLKPVKETLDTLNVQTQQLEVKREGAYKDVLAQVANIQQTHESLRQETSQLVQALRAPKARGNWGELQLRRCIEFAGMVEHCSFDTEVFLRGGDDPALRPDVVVQLPNGRAIIVDAKTPLDAFLSAMNCTDEVQKNTYLQAHALQVRNHLGQLGGKQYWQRFHNSPDFVVCFLPSEVLFSAALEQDASLIEAGSNLNVILATPTTLIALLKAVAYGWQQMEITRNAIAICQAADELYRKLAGTQEHFTKMGNALSSSVKHFNSLVGAVEGRGSVFSLAAKLHELKIGHEEIPEIAPVEIATRELQSDHWENTVDLAASEESEARNNSGQ